MAENVTIARPYARAAFAYARDHNALAGWSKWLSAAAALVQDERVSALLVNPRVSAQDLAALVGDASEAGSDPGAGNFIATLAQNRRLGVLPEIAAMYETLRAEVENIADVQVTSAIPLDDAQRQRLSTALKIRLKRDVRLHCDIDASLVGGAIVRSGDLIIDGSLKGRLDRLAAELAH
jgi:F-type H+-transporting ATPase subunit delta